jgi:hypothetical protein
MTGRCGRGMSWRRAWCRPPRRSNLRPVNPMVSPLRPPANRRPLGGRSAPGNPGGRNGPYSASVFHTLRTRPGLRTRDDPRAVCRRKGPKRALPCRPVTIRAIPRR